MTNGSLELHLAITTGLSLVFLEACLYHFQIVRIRFCDLISNLDFFMKKTFEPFKIELPDIFSGTMVCFRPSLKTGEYVSIA